MDMVTKRRCWIEVLSSLTGLLGDPSKHPAINGWAIFRETIVKAIREREDAEIALFISLEEPTRGMVADAASAGFYSDGAGRKFPRVQLLKIEGLLSGKQRAEHPDRAPDLNFKKAKAEANAAQKELI